MNWQNFDKKYGFSGQLGAIYSPKETTFRVWAPKESGILEVILKSYGKDVSPEAMAEEFIFMELGQASTEHSENKLAIWEQTLEGDQLGLVYTYEIEYEDGRLVETQDPYSVATIVNGSRSVVAEIEEAELGQAGWRLEVPTDAIIEEIHVRDFSVSETSGVSEKHRGKFLGLTEAGTKNEYGDVTGFDYLKSLGANTVQLLPVFDFESVDETKTDGYNWGYDPQNYNVPEGSYATDPKDPTCRIKELKETIQNFHEAGFNVVMDVVYNHVYDRESSSFERLVPDYYFRDSVATGCGNDMASEREMFSKFIVDSVVFWAKHYGFDGFRFDLMGCLDVETMNAVRCELDKLDPRILVYGEGWDMPTDLPDEQKATQKNLGKLPRIGAFNDELRNTVKGTEFDHVEYGFVDGLEMRHFLQKKEKSLEKRLISALRGSKAHFKGLQEPAQMINYVEAHDNLNLNDQLWKNHPKDTADQHSQRVELATALTLLAQGIPFLEIGQAFERTKFVAGDWKSAENSYRSGDLVNQIDWNYVTQHKSTLDFVKSVIAFRKENSIFRLNDFQRSRSLLKSQTSKDQSGLLILGFFQDVQQLKVLINASGKSLRFQVNEAKLLLSNSRTDLQVGEILSDTFEVSDLSLSILTCKGHLFPL